MRGQAATWNPYKNHNTIKSMVGISPRGQVTYVSDTYGGHASDRQIIGRSTLLDENKFEKKDSIMSDRGIIVQDLFASKDVFVNTPTMLKGRNQLAPDTVIHDSRVASKRVHVDRVIHLAKTYKMLSNTIDHAYTPLSGRIVYVCFMLCKFRPCIVNSQC